MINKKELIKLMQGIEGVLGLREENGRVEFNCFSYFNVKLQIEEKGQNGFCSIESTLSEPIEGPKESAIMGIVMKQDSNAKPLFYNGTLKFSMPISNDKEFLDYDGVISRLQRIVSKLKVVQERPIFKECMAKAEISLEEVATDEEVVDADETIKDEPARESDAAEREKNQPTIPKKAVDVSARLAEAKKKALSNLNFDFSVPEQSTPEVESVEIVEKEKIKKNEDEEEASILHTSSSESIKADIEITFSGIKDINRRLQRNKEEQIRLIQERKVAMSKKAELEAHQQNFANAKAAFCEKVREAEKRLDDLNQREQALEAREMAFQKEKEQFDTNHREVNESLIQKKAELESITARENALIAKESSIESRESQVAQKESSMDEVFEQRKAELATHVDEVLALLEEKTKDFESANEKVESLEKKIAEAKREQQSLSDKLKGAQREKIDLQTKCDALEIANKREVEELKTKLDEENKVAIAELEKAHQESLASNDIEKRMEQIEQELKINNYELTRSGSIVNLSLSEGVTVVIDGARNYMRIKKALEKPTKKYKKELTELAKDPDRLIVTSGIKEVLCSTSFGNIHEEIVAVREKLKNLK